jgi:hypothetical protein
VTHPYGPPPADVEAWEAYIATVRHNRNLYLASVGQAKRDYQHDALPVEFAYDEAERHAWMTYYQADKQAWTDFQARLAGDRPPPARSPEHLLAGWSRSQSMPITPDGALWEVSVASPEGDH